MSEEITDYEVTTTYPFSVIDRLKEKDRQINKAATIYANLTQILQSDSKKIPEKLRERINEYFRCVAISESLGQKVHEIKAIITKHTGNYSSNVTPTRQEFDAIASEIKQKYAGVKVQYDRVDHLWQIESQFSYQYRLAKEMNLDEITLENIESKNKYGGLTFSSFLRTVTRRLKR